jgi:hypothetical protein
LGGLVIPPSPRTPSADLNGPRQRRDKASSSRAQGDHITRKRTEAHRSFAERTVLPSIPDDSSMMPTPITFERTQSTWIPAPPLFITSIRQNRACIGAPWTNLPVTYSLPSLTEKEPGSSARQPFTNPVSTLLVRFIFDHYSYMPVSM